MKTQSIRSLLLISLALLAGCDDRVAMTARDDGDSMQHDGVSGSNYTPYYIHILNVKGHDNNGINGGGPNTQPAHPDNIPPGDGGDKRCTSFPKKWRPGLKVTVWWIANKKLDGITWGAWYEAEAEVPEYGNQTFGMWVLFLSGDRVKIVIRNGKGDGPSNIVVKPSDDDPYVAVGMVGAELTRQNEERNEKQRRVRATREAELAHGAELRKQEETNQ